MSGAPPSRLRITRDMHPVIWSEMSISMALLTRLDPGQLLESEPKIVAGAGVVAHITPVWSEHYTSIDYDRWLVADAIPVAFSISPPDRPVGQGAGISVELPSSGNESSPGSQAGNQGVTVHSERRR